MNMAAKVKIVIFTISVLLITQATTKPRPSSGWNELDADIKCTRDIKVQELCQRCAKVTKSDIAYPMCCENEDDAFVWCHKYLNFGLHEIS